MLIKALCDYADKQAKNSTDTPEEGWSRQEIKYRIKLSKDGELLDIFPAAPLQDGKIVNKKIKLPVRSQKPGIDSNTIEHRPLYIFGLNYENGTFTTEDRTDKAKKSHDAFVKHELKFFDGLDSDICLAYRKFIEKWIPQNETENAFLMKLGKEYKNSYFGFTLGVGEKNLEEDEQLKEKYKSIVGKIKEENINAETSVCGILGEQLPVARLHDKLKFPGGQSSGCQLIAMNETAFESYGKTQSFNSNISEKAMKKYTSALNSLLSDKRHKFSLGDMTIVYFAMKENDENECDWFSSLISKSDSFSDEEAEQMISAVMKYAASGYTSDLKTMSKLEADPDVAFYIVGFTPNSSRICQKFIFRDKFGTIIQNLAKHQLDLQIDEEHSRPVYFSSIAKQLISPKSTNDKISPTLMTSIMMSAFNGTKYPDELLATVIRRVKTDSDDEKSSYIKLNDTRAGIIKACLNRKYNREEITMSWNSENTNQAYLCGGLFAVYEKIQQESSGGELNRTIKDAYFASACSRPASVFPTLAKLSQNHLRKLSEGSEIYYSRLTGNLFDGLNGEFPQTLDLDDQGRFIVGYYQMRKSLYTKQPKDKPEDRKEV